MIRSKEFTANLTARQATPRNQLTPKSMLGTVHRRSLPSNLRYGRPRKNNLTEWSAIVFDVDIDVGEATFTWTGGVAPFTLDYGDGDPVVDPATSPDVHDYLSSDTFIATLTDSVGNVETVQVDIDLG